MNDSQVVIGFDFGDSETALSKVLSVKAHGAPEEIFCKRALNSTGIIKTVVGYAEDGRVLVGEEAVGCKNLKHNGLHVGFKVVPEVGDQSYKRLANDFINHLFDHLSEEKLVDIDLTKVIIGHPSRWKHINNGEPVEILSKLIANTRIGKNYELVPESRGAMIEAIEANLLQKKEYESGWVLVIDVGSSTTDFTAVNMNQKKTNTVDDGEEIGARLIDREILAWALEKHPERDMIYEYFMYHPQEKAKFELHCRNCKELYYSAIKEIYAYTLVIDGQYVYIRVDLEDDVMRSIVYDRPVIKINGESYSWHNGFKEVLKNVRNNLVAQGVGVNAVLLTGGASRMDFINTVCVEVFSEKNIVIQRSAKPQFTIANGLARWGRLQIQTDNFMRDIDRFCDDVIQKSVVGGIDEFYSKLSAVIAEKVIYIIKSEFDNWRSGGCSTINRMNLNIDEKIKHWLDVELSNEVKKISGPWIKSISKQLSAHIMSIESAYNMAIGTLAKSFSLNSISGYQINTKADIRDIDITDGLSGTMGNIVGVVSAIIAGVVAFNVIPIVLGIVVYIVGIISTALASALVSVLVSNPVGWAFLVGIFGVALVAGVGAKEYLQEKVVDMNLPKWARELINANTIYDKIESKKNEIYQELFDQLKNQEKLAFQIVEEVKSLYERSLKETAEEARMLIM